MNKWTAQKVRWSRPLKYSLEALPGLHSTVWAFTQVGGAAQLYVRQSLDEPRHALYGDRMPRGERGCLFWRLPIAALGRNTTGPQRAYAREVEQPSTRYAGLTFSLYLTISIVCG